MIVLVSANRGGNDAIQFQTWMVPSQEPDTILVPSGEKPTDDTLSLWALSCCATRTSVDESAHHSHMHEHASATPAAHTHRHHKHAIAQRERASAAHPTLPRSRRQSMTRSSCRQVRSSRTAQVLREQTVAQPSAPASTHLRSARTPTHTLQLLPHLGPPPSQARQQHTARPRTPHCQAPFARARRDPRAVGRKAHGLHKVDVGAHLHRHQRQCGRICAPHHMHSHLQTLPHQHAHRTHKHASSTSSERNPPHTFMLLSLEPDTIRVPSGEKLTEKTMSLWALVSTTSSASVDASAHRSAAVTHLDSTDTPAPTPTATTSKQRERSLRTPHSHASVFGARHDP